MSIFGLVWVASWFSCFSSIGEKLLEAPKYLSHVFSIQKSPPGRDAADVSQALLQNARNSSLHISRFLSTAAPFESQSKQVDDPNQPASAHAVLLGAIASFLSDNSQSSHLRSSPEPIFQPMAWSEASSQPSNPLSYLVEVVQNFVWGVPSRIAEFKGSFPSVVVIQANSEMTHLHRSSSRTGLWRCAVWQENPSALTAMGGFQIWVKGCLVAEVSGQAEADKIARTLEDALKLTDMNSAQLRPGLKDGNPVGLLGDRVVFTFDRDLASQFDRPAELVAIDWVNNLRVALGHSSLSLADAQTEMYSLQNTGERLSGMASWYGSYFHGRETATGEIFDQNELTAAHPSLPFDTHLKVTNLLNGKSVVVRVNDRGPYLNNRVLDLSKRAARCIGSENQGVVPIEAVILQPTLNPTIAASQRLAFR